MAGSSLSYSADFVDNFGLIGPLESYQMVEVCPRELNSVGPGFESGQKKKKKKMVEVC